jgi:lysophospholipase L1-like esterase
MTSRSSWLGRIALALVTVVFVASLGEIALRVVAWRSERSAREARASWRLAHPESADLPELSGVLALARKNVHGIYKGVVVRTDSHGLRGPDRPATAEPGALRIVIAGDSFAFGSGVDEADVYASRLGPMLDEAQPDWRHEVINAGVAGGNIENVMDRLEVAIDAYRPGLYVYGYTLNDIEGRGYELLEQDARTRAWLTWSGAHPLLLVRFLTWQLLTLGGPTSPDDEPYPRELRRNYLDNEAVIERLASGLDRFAALAERNGVCGHVLIHTHLTNLDAEHPFHPMYQRVAEMAAARGLGVTSTFAAFENRDPDSLWINALDSHPNALGHELLARALADDLLALPPACFTRAIEVSAGPAEGRLGITPWNRRSWIGRRLIAAAR